MLKAKGSTFCDAKLGTFWEASLSLLEARKEEELLSGETIQNW